MINLGGFSFSPHTQMIMIIFFVVYSLIIVGLGLYVKFSARNNANNKLSAFITGDGKMNALEIGMVTATVSMAAGVMIGTPGLAYRVGLIHTLCMSSFFMSSFVTLGTFGRKFPIMRKRIHANTISQLMHHRFQSKGVTIALALCGAIFCTILASGQLSGAARIFSLISGGHYGIGLLIATVSVAVYTYSGGVKSLARVSVVQGFIMLAAVIFVGWAEFHNISAQYGSIQAGFEMLSKMEGMTTKVTTGGWTPLYAAGIAIVNSWGVTGIPATLQSTMYYDDPKAMKKGMAISLAVTSIVMGIMCIAGPLGSILNQKLETPDLVVLFVSTNFLPSWMSGIVVCGIFAAIQSSIAGFLVYIAASIASDLYKGCIKTDAPEESVRKLNMGVIIVVVCLAALIALHPVDLIQMLLIFGTGCCAAAYIFPSMLGAYWEKTTAAGALAGILGGPIAYVAAYYASQQEWYINALGNIHPMIISALTGLVLIIVVSLCTQKKKVIYGIYRVWFCKDYDEEFALMYDNGKKIRKENQ